MYLALIYRLLIYSFLTFAGADGASLVGLARNVGGCGVERVRVRGAITRLTHGVRFISAGGKHPFPRPACLVGAAAVPAGGGREGVASAREARTRIETLSRGAGIGGGTRRPVR